jgi:hypothetical protein
MQGTIFAVFCSAEFRDHLDFPIRLEPTSTPDQKPPSRSDSRMSAVTLRADFALGCDELPPFVARTTDRCITSHN